MDEEQAKNAAEANQTRAGDNIEFEDPIANPAGKNAGGGREYVSQGFNSNQSCVSASGWKVIKTPQRIIQCLTADYTDYLRILAKAARIAGSWSSKTVRKSRRTFPSEMRAIMGGE